MTLPKSVNHPSHYGGEDNPYEAIKIIEALGLGFNLGNAIKYISRAGKKGSTVEDLQKAVWYLEREIFLNSPTTSVVDKSYEQLNAMVEYGKPKLIAVLCINHSDYFEFLYSVTEMPEKYTHYKVEKNRSLPGLTFSKYICTPKFMEKLSGDSELKTLLETVKLRIR